jgi:hypothetical protein
MKGLLILSLAANLVLGGLYWKEASRPHIERTIVEAHDEPRIVEKKIFVRVPDRNHEANKSPVTTASPSPETQAPAPLLEFDQKAFEQVVEKVGDDRELFLQDALELTPEDLQRIEKVKKDFYKDADKLILGAGEPSIEQRRQLLDLEEGREREFSRIMGKEKWEKFKKHRDEYNRKNYQKQLEDNSLFIPMEI